MTMSPELQRLLVALGPEGARSLEHLAQAIYNIRFTGPTTIHWLGGRPKQIDLGHPVKLTIVERDVTSRLDKRPPGKPP